MFTWGNTANCELQDDGEEQDPEGSRRATKAEENAAASWAGAVTFLYPCLAEAPRSLRPLCCFDSRAVHAAWGRWYTCRWHTFTEGVRKLQML